MKPSRFALFFLAFPLSVWAGYGTDPDSGLYFNDSKYTLTEPLNTSTYHGVKMDLLVSPEDIPEINHYSNSNMAIISVMVISPGGGAHPYSVNDYRDQVFIVLSGELDYSAGGKTLHARPDDVVYIPPGISRGFIATGNAPAKVIEAEWAYKGRHSAKALRPLVTSERVQPLTWFNNINGYMTVTPNPRQHGIPVSILGFGGHVLLSDAVLLYWDDLIDPPLPPFKANTAMADIALEEYKPGGGTPTHFHTNADQAFIVVSGTGLWEIGANTLEAKRGDIIFAPREVFHGYMTLGNVPLKCFELEWGHY